MYKFINFTLLFLGVISADLPAQTFQDFQEPGKKRELIYHFNEDGTQYIKATFLNQIWARFNQSNPGTTLFGYPKANTFDIGLRRTRIQLFGQLNERVFFYTQIGQNNLSYNSPRKQGLYFLDAISEYRIDGRRLSLGGGLTGWSGLSRYASPSVGTMLTTDAPLYQQATNDATDQFLRKLSIYAKGKIGSIDYRLAISDPMPIQNSNVQTTNFGTNSLFSEEPAKPQYQGYVMYQFLESESNLTPYNVGTYLGKKRILNVGAGFIFQKDAMWHKMENGLDTLRSNLMLMAVDIFYDVPLNPEKGNAFTAYGSFSSNDYGKNYVRNIGAMNPANGTDNKGSFNGTGNSFPIIGTGNTSYVQVGYLFRRDLFHALGTIQPYAAIQNSNFQLLEDTMVMYEGGINWLIDSHASKLSFNYQNRPVFENKGMEGLTTDSRRGMFVCQFQISI